MNQRPSNPYPNFPNVEPQGMEVYPGIQSCQFPPFLDCIQYNNTEKVHFDNLEEQYQNMNLPSTYTSNNFPDLQPFPLSHNQAVNSNFDGLKSSNVNSIDNYHGQIISSQEERSRSVILPGTRPFEQNPNFIAPISQPIDMLESMKNECFKHLSDFFERLMGNNLDFNDLRLHQAEYLLKTIREATTFNEASQEEFQGQTSDNLSQSDANSLQKPVHHHHNLSFTQASLSSAQNNFLEPENMSNQYVFANPSFIDDFRTLPNEELRMKLQSSNLLEKENSALRRERDFEGLNQLKHQHYVSRVDENALLPVHGLDQFNQNPYGPEQNQEHNNSLLIFSNGLLGNDQGERPQNVQRQIVPEDKAKQSEGKNLQVSIVKRVADSIICVKDCRQARQEVKKMHQYIEDQLAEYNLIDEPWDEQSQFKLFIFNIKSITRNSYKEIERRAKNYPQYQEGFSACVSDFLTQKGEEDFDNYVKYNSRLSKTNREILRKDKTKFSLKLIKVLK